MADTTAITPADHGAKQSVSAAASKPRGPSKRDQLNKLYALPAPLRTFPLPTFVPHNPLSLFHILFVWVSQTVRPQPAHLEPLYQGWFSPETRSVHVTDVRSIRGLWEQGFYGKGSLSRSEPQWLELQKTRSGAIRANKKDVTAWEVTSKRRAERQEKKWERARTEREAIELKLAEEASAALDKELQSTDGSESTITDATTIETLEVVQGPEESVLISNPQLAPVGPLGLLALPNSSADLEKLNGSVLCFSENMDRKFVERFYAPPVDPAKLLALPNSIQDYPASKLTLQEGLESMPKPRSKRPANGHAVGTSKPTSAPGSSIDGSASRDQRGLGLIEHVKLEETELVGGSDTNEDTVDEPVHSTHSEDTVETHDAPLNGSALVNGSPSTPKIKRQKSVRFSPTVEKTTFIQSEPPSPERAATGRTTIEEAPLVIRDQEHIQLTFEEAFFLSYALGALHILDPETKKLISNQDLFYLFRKTSYFPPLANPSLSPDDPFMTNYVVYHHFRSLGWVLRSGIKFSVDYMLYVRGPVFTHAEFGVLILPSYSDPYWSSNPFLQNYVKSKETRTWAWMNRIHRVITQVKKTLVLCYVDIPKPLGAEEEAKMGIGAMLARYKVREVTMTRFSANRRRD
jgi:tRNA-splicing endonuclease subunit Sen2